MNVKQPKEVLVNDDGTMVVDGVAMPKWLLVQSMTRTQGASSSRHWYEVHVAPICPKVAGWALSRTPVHPPKKVA